MEWHLYAVSILKNKRLHVSSCDKAVTLVILHHSSFFKPISRIIIIIRSSPKNGAFNSNMCLVPLQMHTIFAHAAITRVCLPQLLAHNLQRTLLI